MKGGHILIERTDNEKSCIEADILDNLLIISVVPKKKDRVVSENHVAETINRYSQEEVISSNTILERCQGSSPFYRFLSRRPVPLRSIVFNSGAPQEPA